MDDQRSVALHFSDERKSLPMANRAATPLCPLADSCRGEFSSNVGIKGGRNPSAAEQTSFPVILTVLLRAAMTFVPPPGYQPVYNPRIPYLGPIRGGLREGMSISILGSIPKDISRFHINLRCSESESGDIALHFNPRFDGWDKVVFNAFKDGSWESEEKIRRMPFTEGHAFETLIGIGAEGYEVKVNGKEFHTFKHRLPVQQVRAIQVEGDVSIQSIIVIGGGTAGGSPGCGMGGGYPGGMGQGGYPGGSMGGGYPGGQAGGSGGGYPGGCVGGMGPGGFPGSNLPGLGGQPIHNPVVPFSTIIPGGMHPKKTFIIRGQVPFGADRFAINFVASRSGNMILHLNPRLRKGEVVRNSLIGGDWGKEERQLSTNPFREGQFFDMSIRCGNQKFKVFVNGEHVFDFSHRTSFHEIDTLEIRGDVQIYYVHF
ncbi:Galectin-4 [Oryzias melastigma]|uniref:Galectin n=2 Tax=Oryzias melastigma TaxID=30732 RepID=A0A834F1W4_ORYME|nr:Galectin-4 [Oryzias melastigma]